MTLGEEVLPESLPALLPVLLLSWHSYAQLLLWPAQRGAAVRLSSWCGELNGLIFGPAATGHFVSLCGFEDSVSQHFDRLCCQITLAVALSSIAMHELTLMWSSTCQTCGLHTFGSFSYVGTAPRSHFGISISCWPAKPLILLSSV